MYPGDLAQFAFLVQWIHERCVPLVREITFANGEELTEEGLPLLLLFYNPDDPSIKETFRKRVEAELGQHRGTVNVVTADGVMFAHPLHHLGKHKNVGETNIHDIVAWMIIMSSPLSLSGSSSDSD